MGVNDDNIVVSEGILELDGTDVGHLADAVTVRVEREYLDVESQRRKGVVKKVLTSERMYVSTSLHESTLTNLMKAWDQQGTAEVSGTSANIGGVSSNEHTLSVVGQAPNDKSRTFTIYRAVNTDAGELSFNKNEDSSIPVEFECLKDTNNTDGDGNPLFGTIVDEA